MDQVKKDKNDNEYQPLNDLNINLWVALKRVNSLFIQRLKKFIVMSGRISPAK
jgi:hypothetical protein